MKKSTKKTIVTLGGLALLVGGIYYAVKKAREYDAGLQATNTPQPLPSGGGGQAAPVFQPAGFNAAAASSDVVGGQAAL